MVCRSAVNPGHQMVAKMFLTSDSEALTVPHDFWQIYLQRQTNTRCSGQEGMKRITLQNQVRWYLSVSFIIKRFLSFNFYPVLKIPLGLKIRSCCPIIDRADLYISVVLLGLVCEWHWQISGQFRSLHFASVCCSTWPSIVYPKTCRVFKHVPYCCRLPCHKVFPSSCVVNT